MYYTLYESHLPANLDLVRDFFKSTNAEALPSVFLIKLDRLVLEIIFLSFFGGSNVLPGWKAGAVTWAQVQRLLLKDLHFLQLNIFSYIGPWILKTFFFIVEMNAAQNMSMG